VQVQANGEVMQLPRMVGGMVTNATAIDVHNSRRLLVRSRQARRISTDSLS
jgi:hypothetical protein